LPTDFLKSLGITTTTKFGQAWPAASRSAASS